MLQCGVLAIATYCAREEELCNLVIDWVQEGLLQNSIKACSLQQAATTSGTQLHNQSVHDSLCQSISILTHLKHAQ